MNLRDLHSPQPLRDADFAAIRARVRSRIRERRSVWPMLLRFAFAAALFVVFVPHVAHRAPRVPQPAVVAKVVVPEAQPVRTMEAATATASLGARSTPSIPRERTRRRTTRVVQPPSPEVARIELQTADPEIRIIWIINKESS